MKDYWFPCIVILLGGVGICVEVSSCTMKQVQQEAIQHQAAEWQINPQTGERKFVWKGREE